MGLMQLMPDTARQVARGERITISTNDLVQPDTNIRLGSVYLRGLFDRYSGNRVLATAAYNAGPSRISKWVNNQTEALPADVWIEVLPYRETREYVQNVLAFAVIYGQRLGQPTPLLKESEKQIGNSSAALAENSKNAH
jgi:soluble lytic murein transglycosylase